MNILVIDDEPDICKSLSEFLRRLGHGVRSASNGAEGLKVFHSEEIDLIITDIRMPVIDGLELLKRIKTIEQSSTDVIVFTGHGDMDNAIKALQYGAFDYLLKPVNVKELAITIDRAAEYAKLRSKYKNLKSEFKDRVEKAVHFCRGETERIREAYLSEVGLGELYVFSDGMRDVLSQAEKYSGDRSIPVLVEGESGTGKELIARYIHHFNPDSSLTPFVAINCGALTENLIESELFGHEAGAYTGATQSGRMGKLEVADGGTLFLDEIGEMPLNLQVKLLRLLEDRKFYRLGGTKEKMVDIRVICATNKNLQREVETKTFRLDLYYRVSIGNIKIPALRKRRDAILPFAHRFVSRAFKRHGKQFQQFSPAAEEFLRNFSWPGNVRQIKNSMERLALLKTGGNIDIQDLSFIENIYHADVSHSVVPQNDMSINNFVLPEQSLHLDDLNRKIIILALKKFEGNQTKTASFLGMTRRKLQGRVKKWNIPTS
jgi:two-component system response regulator AtoC